MNAALLVLFAFGPADPAASQVYRCEEGDTTVFTDVPCAENAERLQMRSGISVVAAANDLDEVAERNKAFLDQRQEKLAARRARAEKFRQRAERDRQPRSTVQDIRYRTIIGPAADPGFGRGRLSPTDPRIKAQRRQANDDESARRRTLLSRSGGNQPRILR